MSKKNENTKTRKTGFIKAVRNEMKKVIWPTRKEMISYTSVVIVTCIIISLVIWAFDSAFSGALQAALGLKL